MPRIGCSSWGLNEGSCTSFILRAVFFLLLRFLYFNNAVDCHGLLKEAGMLGLNGGNCRRFILRVVVGVITPFFILIMLFYVF